MLEITLGKAVLAVLFLVLTVPVWKFTRWFFSTRAHQEDAEKGSILLENEEDSELFIG